jgi:DNA topoisomerase IA
MFNNTNNVSIDIVSDHSNDRAVVYSSNALEKIDPELSLPTMRSDMEQQLNLIASGKASHKEVLVHFLKMFEKKFEYFIKSVV